VTVLLAAALAAGGVALLLTPPPAPGPSARASRPGRAAGGGLGGPAASLASAVLAGGALSLLVGGATGLLVGAAGAVGAALLLRGLARRDSRASPVDEQQVALAADLVAAVVEAGLPVPAAVAAVAAHLRGPTAQVLSGAARLLSVGAAPESALAALLADPASARVGRALLAALDGGASPVPMLEAAAAAQRDRARSTLVARSRAIGSKAALPVGLCFLPAFVLVAIVPVVVGGLSSVLARR
jgi:pilus assembly protein TadC